MSVDTGCYGIAWKIRRSDMQELEKILEEIDETIERYGKNPYIDEKATELCYGMTIVKDIIRKHMDNDGWIPVEERLPEKEYYTAICVTDKNHYCIAVYNKEYGFRTGDIEVEGEIIAWRPIPGIYNMEAIEIKRKDELEAYKELGTVEECREAREKQKPKKPDYEGDGYADGHMVYDTWICPCCRKRYEVEYDNYEHCQKCGQAIANENLEEIENE